MGNGLAAQAHYKLVEKLAESEHRFRELVELQRDIVFRCDGAGVLEYMSPAVQETLGVAPEACVGRPLEELIESADPDAQRRARLILQGVPQAQGCRFRFRTSGGRSRWLELQARQRLGGGSVGTLRDVTEVVVHERERSRLHAELVERNAQLKVQDRRREEQAAALRHRYDLQEVLTHISARMLEAPQESIDAAIEDVDTLVDDDAHRRRRTKKEKKGGPGKGIRRRPGGAADSIDSLAYGRIRELGFVTGF